MIEKSLFQRMSICRLSPYQVENDELFWNETLLTKIPVASAEKLAAFQGKIFVILKIWYVMVLYVSM